jgi:hypothetical protein
MKQTTCTTSHSLPHARLKDMRPGAAFTTMLLALFCLASFSGQAQVSNLPTGKLLHLRLTNYEFSAQGSKDSDSRSWDSNIGLELVYERVGEGGRGTRYLVGWSSVHESEKSRNSSLETTERSSSNQTFRIGMGKSQAVNYKKLVLRGGADAYLQFGPGGKDYSFFSDSLATVSFENETKYAPSFGLAVRPFVGLGVQVGQRLALGIEYGFTAGLTTTLGSDRTEQFRSNVSTFTNSTKVTRFGLFASQTSFLPFVNLSYSF